MSRRPIPRTFPARNVPADISAVHFRTFRAGNVRPYISRDISPVICRRRENQSTGSGRRGRVPRSGRSPLRGLQIAEVPLHCGEDLPGLGGGPLAKTRCRNRPDLPFPEQMMQDEQMVHAEVDVALHRLAGDEGAKWRGQSGSPEHESEGIRPGPRRKGAASLRKRGRTWWESASEPGQSVPKRRALGHSAPITAVRRRGRTPLSSREDAAADDDRGTILSSPDRAPAGSGARRSRRG